MCHPTRSLRTAEPPTRVRLVCVGGEGAEAGVCWRGLGEGKVDGDGDQIELVIYQELRD